ncbi:MAG: MucBP domain-containing protein [Tissierellia bacterium]|nr:MucBP domain-containing protein [Tissierellia bacterium]
MRVKENRTRPRLLGQSGIGEIIPIGKRRQTALLLALLMILQAFVPILPVAKVEAAEVRETVRFPNENYSNINPAYTNGGFFSIPDDPRNSLVINGKGDNFLNIVDGEDNHSIANSNVTFNPLTQNAELQLNLNLNLGASSTDPHIMNRGMAIVLHGNGIDQSPGDSASALGVYGSNKVSEIQNSVAIEFDLWGNGGEYDPGITGYSPHIAITKPIIPSANDKINVVHDALTEYPTLADNKYRRVIVTWTHTSNGVDGIENTADDLYSLMYRFYDTDTPMADSSYVYGQRTYTAAAATTLFGGNEVRFAITGGSYDTATMSAAFPAVHQYTVSYLVQDKEGNPTTTLVPGISPNPVKKSTSRSTIDLAPLPNPPPGYELVTGQRTIKYVSGEPADNNFVFYYKPQYVPVQINYHIENMAGSVEEPNFTTLFSSHTKLYGFVGDEATAPTLEEILTEMVKAGTISQATADMYNTWFTLDSGLSNIEGTITADNPQTLNENEGLILNLYYRGSREVPYTVKYQLQGSNQQLLDPISRTDGIITQSMDLSEYAKEILGYQLVTTDFDLLLNETKNYEKIFEYKALDSTYTVRHLRQTFAADNSYSYEVFESDSFAAETGTNVIGTPKKYLGYSYEPLSSKPTGLVKGDGSLELELRYSADRTFYLVEHYLLDNEGVATSYQRLALQGNTGSYVKGNPIPIEGYDYSGTLTSGQVIGLEDNTDPNNPNAYITTDDFKGLVLKLYYTPDLNIPVTIRHTLADGTIISPDRVGAYSGAVGETIDVAATTVPGYSVTGTPSVPYTIKARDNIVTFIYEPRSDTNYSVEFYKNNEKVGSETRTGTTGQEITADPEPSTQTIIDELAGYSYNEEASALFIKGVIKADGSLVLRVYYHAADDTEYHMEYYMQNADGTWPTTATYTIPGYGTTGGEATFSATPFAGFAYDSSHLDNFLSGTITGDPILTLKGYYTANTDTAYSVEHYIQSAPDSTEYTLHSTQDKTGTTGTPLPKDGDALTDLTGYAINSAKTLATTATIAGNGSMIVRYYYDLTNLPITVNYFVSQSLFKYTDGSSDLPYAVQASYNLDAKIGERITPKALTEMTGYGAHHGFLLDMAKSDPIPARITAEDTTINVYYRGISNRPYVVEHYIRDIAGGNVEVLKRSDEYVDGISGATIQLGSKVLSTEHTPGFTYDSTSYSSSVYSPNTSKREGYTSAPNYILYPNTSYDPQLIIKLFYTPKEDTSYQIQHYVPDGAGGYRVALTEYETGITSSIVTADLLSGIDDIRLKGYSFDRGNTNNLRSARLQGDGSTVLKLYYTTTQTDYSIEYYLQKADGSYDALPSQRDALRGVTDSIVYASVDQTETGAPKQIPGYTYLPGSSGERWSGQVVGDGSLTLKLYYAVNDTTPYTVQTYLQGAGGVGYQLSETKNLSGMTNTQVSVQDTSLPGYTFDSSISTKSGVVQGDGSLRLKLYYSANATTIYTIETYLQESDGSYPATPSRTSTGMGQTGSTVHGTAPRIESYAYDPEHSENITSSVIAGDGSTVIKFYYTANDIKDYTVHYILKTEKGEHLDLAPEKLVENPVDEEGNPLKVGSIVTETAPEIDGYEMEIGQPTSFVLYAESNDIYFYYTVDTTQKFNYQINYYRVVPGDVDEDYQSIKVPGITANPVMGSANVGQSIDILHPEVDGYKIASNQPTQLIVANVNADAAAAEGTLDQKSSNYPGDNVVNIFYLVNLDETYPYQIDYFLDGSETKVPGLSPNPVLGDGAAEQRIMVNHPENLRGYKVKDAQISEFDIFAGDADNTIDGNQLMTKNHKTVYYVVDESQLFTYRIDQFLLKDNGGGSFSKTKAPVPGTSQIIDKEPVDRLIDLNMITAPNGYRLATEEELGEAQSTTLTVTSDNLAQAALYYLPDENQYVGYEVHYQLEDGRVLADPLINENAGMVGSTVSLDAIEVPGYSPIKTNDILTLSTGENIYIFWYRADNNIKYTVNYYEEDTTDKLADSKEVLGQTMAAEVKELALSIPGYTPDAASKSITLAATGNEINFYYTKTTDISYMVHYVDESGHPIAESKLVGGKSVGDEVTEEAIAIAGYVKPTDPQTITLKASGNVITFVYGAGTANYVVESYLQQLDGSYQMQTPASPISGTTGTTVDITAADIQGYTYKAEISTSTGVIKADGSLVLRLYYNLTVDNQYTVHYHDEDGNAIATSKLVSNQPYGVTVTETAPAITGYNLPDSVSQEITVDRDENQSITFVYETSSVGTVTANYVDEEGNRLSKTEFSFGPVGDPYKTNSKTIAGYTLIETKGEAEGFYTAAPIIVSYIYRADDAVINGTIVERYITMDGMEEIDLAEYIISNGEIGAAHTLTDKTFGGYTLSETKYHPTTEDGTEFINGLLTVTKVYTADTASVQGTIILRHVIDGTQTEIADRQIYTGTGDQIVSALSPLPAGYILAENPVQDSPQTVTQTPGTTQTITYRYLVPDSELYGTILVKYVDESGRELAERVYTASDDETATYTLLKPTVDGYEYKETKLDGVSYTESNVNYAPGSTQTVEVVYKQVGSALSGTIIVKYVDQNGRELLTRETTAGLPADPGIAKSHPSIAEYEFISATLDGENYSEGSTVNYTAGITKQLLFTYKPLVSEVSGIVITKHILEGSSSEIAERVETRGEVDSNYSTASKSIHGYTLQVTPTNHTGQYIEGVTTVTYEYTRTTDTPTYADGIVIVKYVDEDGNEIALRTQSSGTIGDDYSTTAKTIGGYNLTSTPTNETGEYAEGVLNVVYVYSKTADVAPDIEGTIVVKHVDATSGDEIFGRDETSGKVGTTYMTEAKPITGYGEGVHDTASSATTGNYSEGIQTVIYKYTRTSDPSTVMGNLVVKHIDATTKAEISARLTDSKEVETEYSTSVKTITGYQAGALASGSAAANGTYAEGATTVIYEYAKVSDPETIQSPKVIVKYVDGDGNEIAGRTEQSGALEETFTVPAKTIAGFSNPTPATATGTYTDGIQTITILYTQISDEPQAIEGTVIVKHMEKGTTTEIYGRDTLTGAANDSNVTYDATLNKKIIEGYGTAALRSGTEAGQYQEGIHIVIYEYEKTSDPSIVMGNLVVKHIDATTKAEISSRVTDSKEVDAEYTAFAKTITGYQEGALASGSAAANGTYVEGTTTVIYEYAKVSDPESIQSPKVIVKYVDGDGNEIAGRTEQSGALEETFTVPAKTIAGFSNPTPATATGTYTDGIQTITILYTQISDEPQAIEGTVIVKHMEKGTTNEIYGRDTLTGNVNDASVTYDTKTLIKTIEGYGTASLRSGTETGQYQEGIHIVIYEYEKTSDPSDIQGTVLVKHILKDSNVEIAARVESSGTVGTDYTTSTKSIAGYTAEAAPTNASGTYAEGLTTVLYEYTRTTDTPTYADGIVIVKYVDNDGEEIALRSQLSGEMGSTYEITAKTIYGYEVDDTKLPANAEGEYAEGVIEVIYHYTKVSDTAPTLQGTIIVKHMLKGSITEILGREEITQNTGTTYSTAAKVISGYEAGTHRTTSAASSGPMIEGIHIVIYEYEKTSDPSTVMGNLVVKHIDATTRAEIAARVTGEGEVGTSYTTTPKTISGYTVGDVPANANGTYAEGVTTVTYEYTRNTDTPSYQDGIVVVKYVDEEGNEIALRAQMSGAIGDDYSTEAKNISGYTVGENPINASGKYGEGVLNVVYVYAKTADVAPEVEGTIVVKHVDATSGDEIFGRDETSGKMGTTYSTEAKSITGYGEGVHDTASSATAGTYSEGIQTVIYKYTRTSDPSDIQGTVLVKHILKDSNVEIAARVESSGTVGTDYSTSAKTIAGYSAETAPANVSGTYAEGLTTVIYEYTRTTDTPTYADGIVVVKYVDSEGTEIALRSQLSGEMGSTYETTAKTINGYELDDTKLPVNATGEYGEGVIEVTYHYTKDSDTAPTLQGTILVKHMLNGSDTEILGREEITQNTGTTYSTSAKTISGYEAGTHRTTSTAPYGPMLEGIHIVIYEYEKTSDPSTVMGNLVVKHIDATTKAEIAIRETDQGEVGTAYSTAAKSIPGYTSGTNPANANGDYAEGITTVIYVYTRDIDNPTYQDGIIVVKYTDTDGNEITLRTQDSGKIGDPYTTTAKEISGYTLDTTPTNANGNFAAGITDVIYIYSKDENPLPEVEGTILVRHLDAETGDEIFGRDEITKTLGSDYLTTAKDISGYKPGVHDAQSAPVSGKIAEGIHIVIYEYEVDLGTAPVTGTLITKFVDEENLEIAERVTQTLDLGESYTTTAKTILGYQLLSDSGNTLGIIPAGVTTVTYRYQKVTTTDTPTIDQPIVGDTQVKGTAEPNADVLITVDGTEYPAKADAAGGYAITVPSLTTGSTVTATAKAAGKEPSQTATSTVQTLNGLLQIKMLSDSGEELKTDFIFDEVGKNYEFTPPFIDGYSYKELGASSAPLLGTITKAPQTVTLIYTADAQPTAPEKPTVNLDIYDDQTEITGTAVPGNTVTLRNGNGDVLGQTTADELGNYEIPMAAQLAGTILDVIQTDPSTGLDSPRALAAVLARPAQENQPPVIHLQDQIIQLGDSFDPMNGVTATDAEDGDLTGSVRMLMGEVNPDVPGNYEIVYIVEDSAGATAIESRTITVEGKPVTNTAPNLTAQDLSIPEGSSFQVSDLKPVATDEQDGDLTDQIVVLANQVDSNAPGKYSVLFMVEDSEGLKAYHMSTVTVTAKEKPPVNPDPAPNPEPRPDPDPKPNPEPTPVEPKNTIERISGATRFETSVEISKKSMDSADTVILVNADVYPDALTATVLADLIGAPILGVTKDGLPAVTASEIARLGARNIILIGGENTIAANVAEVLDADYSVDRIGGANRYETANQIAERILAIKGSLDSLILAKGDDFPDALVISSLAVRDHTPILLTGTAALPESTKALIDRISPSQIILAGGPMSISPEIETSLKLNYDVMRLAGKDRYETSTIVAEYVYPNATTAFVASGEVFIDALMVGPLTDEMKAPILLTRAAALPAPIQTYLAGDGSEITRFILVGGERTITPAVAEELR